MTDSIGEWQQQYGVSDAAVQALVAMSYPQTLTTDAKNSNDTSNLIRAEASKYGLAMWRNNSGVLRNEENIPIRFGLGNVSKKINKVWKSSDLIGVGFYGRIVFCEVKPPAWKKPQNEHERAQLAALMQVNALGGIGFFATSVHDYRIKVLGFQW